MTEKQSFFKRIFEDLKRRHVVRVAIGYIIVSWVILQVADVLLPALDLDGWVFRALLTTAFIGFFVVVIFAWIFDISDHHIVKTKGIVLPRWVRSVISLPLIAAVGLGGGGGSGPAM
jgi:O-antigen/teichoic acid export membrane protein